MVGALEFMAALVSSLAWPMAVCGIALAIRRPIIHLLPRLSNLKYGDLELDFSQELSEIEERAQAAKLGTSPEAEDGARDLLSEVNAVAAISPLAAIPLAWTAIEGEIDKTLTRMGITFDRRRQPSADIRALERAELIDHDLAIVLNRLRGLRNEAAHAAHSRVQLSRTDAEEYAQLAADVINTLRNVQPRSEEIG